MNRQDYRRTLKVNGKEYSYFDITLLQKNKIADIDRLPFSIRILVENLLRKLDDNIVKHDDILEIANWKKSYASPAEIPYHPARVLMQDFTGVPAVVDLAAMRDAVRDLGGDPAKVNPLVPVELVVDHSVQVDYYGTTKSLTQNVAKEYERNHERYTLLKWAQISFDNFNVVPPNSGICHQVNLEYLGRVVIADDKDIAYPDTVVGLDSHTPMINGIGVMAWGVGGIEAEAVMLGQPYYMSIPQVVGVRLTGNLKEGTTATDLVLTVTELLRKNNVVEKFVEFFGTGVANLSIPDRATISNMTPEYGATMGFFPIDAKTIDYLRQTGRTDKAELTEAYARANKLFLTEDEQREYSQIIELELSTVTPSLAGPARPQDRIPLPRIKDKFEEILGCDYDRDTGLKNISEFHQESGNQTVRPRKCAPAQKRVFTLDLDGKKVDMGDGSVVIAAITSCTNTSNPHVLMGAGLMAKKAVTLGLHVPSYVKTSLAPGSKVVRNYLQEAGLTPYFEALGFHLAAFGCTTCIGNSGPLSKKIDDLIEEHDLNVAAVLSGNRNFEARIHQRIKSNFLMSPMLVIAFALAGRIDIDLTASPLGHTPNGEPVYLKDLWPANAEIEALIAGHVSREGYEKVYSTIFEGDDFWKGLEVTESTTFAWDPNSTYIKKPPYFDNFTTETTKPVDIEGARPLALLGDSVTTDHISPAGSIPVDYPAGKYLISQNVKPVNFNSYGSRRGNHEIMMRGTFGNIRIKNKMVSPREGSFTLKKPEEKEMYIYDAAMEYAGENIPLVVLGGKEYGTGSSRDWAAKGTNLLGIKAVLAQSYERIHRNNLVGMGILPLVFKAGDSLEKFKIKGNELFRIEGLQNMRPQQELTVHVTRDDGLEFDFKVNSRLDTDIDITYYQHGGILPYVLRKIMAQK
ncbi:aconitate hydratase AcnA [Desulfopila inferna]|uniref:aconitate hydratase AcnA n=1 Tax=Desulfopila inferna TaxID=468528 RepID=UPI0019639703|nr:aconitate hydratase AcnA [Desulfopila inferna]MBM9603286.1 aconitate hydratase AcnA [Desulfopila inferna]